PAGHTRAARNLGRQALPRYTRIEHKQDADQRIAGCNRRTTALRARSGNRHQRGDLCPQIIRKEFLGHASKLTPTWLTKGFVRRSKLLDRAQRVDDLITTLKALLPELDATDAAIWGGLRAARVTPPGAVVRSQGSFRPRYRLHSRLRAGPGKFQARQAFHCRRGCDGVGLSRSRS